MCCENPFDLGCHDSCETVEVITLAGTYVANELYIRYNFNGAVRKELITEVNADGKPIIDLSKLNEDYIYTFEIVQGSTGESLGCYKIKVDPCAGEYLDFTEPVTDYVNSILRFVNVSCAGETVQELTVTIPGAYAAAIIDGTIINLFFDSDVPITSSELLSSDPNIEIISNRKVKILTEAGYTGVISLTLKIAACTDRVLDGVVSSIENLAPTWGSGIHTPDQITINL